MDRESKIVCASITSIVGNALLSAIKGIAGTLSGSIAITLDAINSLADALSSVIAIIGAKLAGRSADRNHPFGFGRVEYLSSIVIAALILAAGISSLIEAIRSIIHPTTPQYTMLTLTIVAIAAVVKLILGLFLLREGKALDSGSLLGSGADSTMDAGVSAATLVAGILYLTLGWQIEAWLAAAIAILIIRGGIILLIETSSKLLGERVSPEVAAQVEMEARAIDEVKLASGLVLLDFGPNRLTGALHVTVDSQMTTAEFDKVARAVQARVNEKCGITLVGVTPYPAVSQSDSVREVRASIGRIVWSHDHVVELRGLYVEENTLTARFDAIVDFDAGDLQALHDEIEGACKAECPDWLFDVRVLPDIGD